METRNYLKQTSDPTSRAADYRELVKHYYESVTRYYQHGWGDRFHFAPFQGDETVDAALTAQNALLAKKLELSSGMTALDVGCGVGGPARRIAKMTGAHITGITISPTQVEEATKLTRKQGLEKQCEFLLEDAMHTRFADGSFDRVYMIESACHMPDKAAFYKECARVLKPGGILGGWDWIRVGNLSPEEMRAYIEPICVYFALPTLSSLEEIGGHLTDAGLEVAMLEDLDTSGSATRKWWTPLEKQLSGPLTRISAKLSSTLGMMKTSGDLLVSGARAGAFSALGFFVARKPS